MAAALLGALGMITLLALGARTEAVSPVTRVPAPSNTDLGQQTPPQPSAEGSGMAPQPSLPPATQSATAQLIGDIIQTALIIAGILAVLVIIVLVVRKVAAGEAPPGIDELGEDAVDLTEVTRHLATSRRDMTVSGDIRAAIVACWEGLESAVGEAGRTSRASHETASEFVTRVLAAGDLSPTWTVRLADLYERALFSHDELTEADRERALQALTELTDEIDREHAEPAPTPAPSEADSGEDR